jgi:cytochrome c oxidase assembly protein subunit 19
MTDAFGGSRVQIKPPERGVFALDHEGECKDAMKTYLACIRRKDVEGDHFPCKQLSRAYLQCRMDRDLMSKEDLDNLGLGDKREYVRKQVTYGEKERKGFQAGLGVKASNKGFFK